MIRETILGCVQCPDNSSDDDKKILNDLHVFIYVSCNCRSISTSTWLILQFAGIAVNLSRERTKAFPNVPNSSLCLFPNSATTQARVMRKSKSTHHSSFLFLWLPFCWRFNASRKSKKKLPAGPACHWHCTGHPNRKKCTCLYKNHEHRRWHRSFLCLVVVIVCHFWQPTKYVDMIAEVF